MPQRSQVLLLEVRTEQAQLRERQDRRVDVLARRDQIGLVRDVEQRRLVNCTPCEHETHSDREPDAEADDEHDRQRQPRAEALHAAWSLYPAPRTVRIESGSPSFRRSCATCTSTVRVPPG